jgi:hypothetical protein
MTSRIEIIDIRDIKTKDGVIELDAEATVEGPDGQMHPGKVYLRFNVESAQNTAARLTAQLPLARSQLRR